MLLGRRCAVRALKEAINASDLTSCFGRKRQCEEVKDLTRSSCTQSLLILCAIGAQMNAHLGLNGYAALLG